MAVIFAYLNDLVLYLYKSEYTNYWHIMLNEIDDKRSYAFCTEENVVECSGEWFSYSGSSSQMYQEQAGIVLYCSQESDYFDQRFLDKNYSKIAASYK